MRIYANEITEKEIMDAAINAKVSVERLRVRRSRQYTRSFDVVLSGSGPRRSQYADRVTPAATWDEWGIFLAQLFDHEPGIKAGPYRNRDHFGWATDGRYCELSPDQQHRLHRWSASWEIKQDDFGRHVEQQCPCGAIRRWELDR